MKDFKESMFKKKKGLTQKSQIYYDAYTHMFSTYDTDQSLKILEIGVRGGGGLYTLKEHFPNSTIIGLDIDSGCKQWEDINENIHVRIGDQSDIDVLQNLMNEFSSFDIIIDDGSHVITHQINSFKFLFPKMVNGGLYVVEDLHTSYWKDFYNLNELSAINYFSDLAQWPTKRWAPNTNRSIVSPISELTEVETCIDSVHFYDSICFLKKTKSDIELNKLISDYKQFFITQ